MSIYILSTMAHAVSYRFYKDVSGLPMVQKSITIHGGASLPSETSGFGDRLEGEDGRPIWTAAGTVTAIKDEDYEILKDHTLFKKHVENRYLTVVQHDIRDNHKEVKKIAANMEQDGREQLNEKKLKTKIKTATVAGKKAAEDENLL